MFKNLLFLLALLAASSCSNADYNATFIGYDYNKCLCCGGYKITLDNGDKVIGVDISETLGGPETKKFPFYATIEYSKSDNCEHVILIKKFEEE